MNIYQAYEIADFNPDREKEDQDVRESVETVTPDTEKPQTEPEEENES